MIASELRDAPLPELPPGYELLEPAPERKGQWSGPDGVRVGVLLKRTYEDDGRGGLTLADAPVPLFDAPFPWSESASGEDPPPASDEDTLALRPGTDVVVQGSAYAPGGRAREGWVRFEGAGLKREIRVFGDRRLERTPGGAWRIAEPAGFTSIPLRYDRAYGGHDARALARHGDPQAELMELIDPELASGPGLYHYPRNPAGTGYVVDADDETLAELRLPNFEFPFDPLTVERLVAGRVERWIRRPLPAALDWVGSAWFPRVAYLGIRRPHDLGDAPPAEVLGRWAAPDLMQIESPLKSGRPPRLEFHQGASPGMTLARLRPDAAFRIEGMSADGGVHTVRLPGEWPEVELRTGPETLKAAPHLNSVCMDREAGTLMLVWCATARVERPLSPVEIAGMETIVTWRSADRWG
ncbi:MAG: DUF2169 domain-containing protein [Gemmatimonadota bacterium]